MELDVPPASASVAGVGAVGPTSAAVDGVLDDIAVVGAAVAVGAVAAAEGRPPVPLPADAYCWKPEPPSMVSGGGGTTLGAEGEEVLTSKGWVKTRRHNR
jgi:hypothetical protein